MARGSQFVVDLNVIETECENLKKCYDKYTNNTYSYFKNSYLTKCTDNRIKTAINKISKYYKNVEQDYTAICNWWKSYIDNVKGLEDYLSGKGTSTLSEQSLINYLKGSLEKLQDYNFDIGILYSTVNKQLFSYNVQTNEIKNINNNSSNKNQTYNVDTEIENLNGISNNSSNTKQNYNINNEIRNLDNLSNYQNNDFKTNGISGSFNSVNKNLNANGGTGYNGKFNTNTDEFDFNKNQSGNNNIAGSNIEFDGIENIFTDSNLDVKGQELTFEDVFGSTSKSNNAKVDYSRLVDIDIDNSRLGEFSNNININSRALADDKENFQVNKSSFSLAGGAVLGLGFSNMGKNNSKNNSKNSSSSTSTYTQGSYSSAYTDIDHDNSNLVNEKNLKQNRGYVYSMGMQNIEMHNPNFSFTGIKDLSKKILGLIKTIKTNSIVILETDTIDYKSSEIATAIDETNAKVDTANSIDIINQTETVKTNTTSKPNVFAAAFLNSKIFQDIVGMTTSSINIEDGKTKFDFDTFVDNAYMTAVTNFNEAKENVSKFLGHNPLLKNLEKLGSNAFNSLNVKMSHNNDKKYVESNEHVELGELCEWVGVELSPIAQRKATKELEAANSVIDSYYTRYGDLSELSFKLYSLKKDKDNNFVLSSDDTQELIALILKVNDRSMLSDEENVSELDKQLDVLLTKLCKGNDLTEADAELINNLVGLLCAEKTMDKQIIHQLEIARDQIPYKFIAENSDYAELSDYSEFYNNTATISYDESTASWVVNGKSLYFKIKLELFRKEGLHMK